VSEEDYALVLYPYKIQIALLKEILETEDNSCY